MEVVINTVCFVCNSKPKQFYRALSVHQTPSSQTALNKLISTLLADIQSTRCIDNAVDIICKGCVDRLHNYDRLFCEVHRAQSELSDLLKRTEASFAVKQEHPFDDPLDIDGAVSIPPVVTIRRLVAAKGNVAAAQVVEQKVAKVETWPPAIDGIVEPLSVDEMLSASETGNAAPAIAADDTEMSDTVESDWADDFEWQLDEEEEEPELYKLHKCFLDCDRVYKSRKLFLRHLHTHHGRYCTACTIEFPTAVLYESHMLEHGADGGTCSVCKFECNSADALVAHMHKHRTAVQFQCVLCDTKASGRRPLIAHVKRMHIIPMVTMCNICGKFISSGGLNVHLEQHNIKSDVNYQCSMCPKVFKTHSRRLTHQSTHKKVSRFECSTCGAKFKRKFNLQLHEKRHVMDTKTIPCTMCEARFEHKFYLKQHLRNKHRIFDAGEKIQRNTGDAGSGDEEETEPSTSGAVE